MIYFNLPVHVKRYIKDMVILSTDILQGLDVDESAFQNVYRIRSADFYLSNTLSP